MIKQLRVGAAVAAAGLIGLVLAVPRAVTADDNKAAREGIEKLVELIEKKDAEGVKKQAQAFAEKAGELEAVMALMEPRTKGGFGFGKPGMGKADGIEVKLADLATKNALTPAELKEQGEAIRQMALRIAAISEVALHHAPSDKKKAAKWTGFGADMRDQALKLAEAKTPEEVKAVAAKLNNSCAGCHTEFK